MLRKTLAIVLVTLLPSTSWLMGQTGVSPGASVSSLAPVKTDRQGVAFTANAIGKVGFLFPASQGFYGGVRAEYFKGKNLEESKLVRQEKSIGFDFAYSSPGEGVPADLFSARYTAKIRVDRTGEYTFYTRTDDGVRLSIDDKLIVDRWQDMGTTEFNGKITLNSGKTYDLRMEYYDAGGYAAAHLLWSGPELSKSIVGTIDDLTLDADSIETAGGPVAIRSADMNGDGKDDLVVLHQGFPGKITVLLQKANGFQSLEKVPTGMDPGDIALADMTGDGRPDVIVSNRISKDIWILASAAGVLTKAQSISTAKPVKSLAVGDVDGDGKMDIVGSTSDGIVIYSGKTSFAEPVSMAGEGFIQVALVTDSGKKSIAALAADSVTIFKTGEVAGQKVQLGSGCKSMAVVNNSIWVGCSDGLKRITGGTVSKSLNLEKPLRSLTALPGQIAGIEEETGRIVFYPAN